MVAIHFERLTLLWPCHGAAATTGSTACCQLQLPDSMIQFRTQRQHLPDIAALGSRDPLHHRRLVAVAAVVDG